MNKISNTKYQILGIYLTLAVVTVLSFWQLHNCDFIVYDDLSYVTQNPHVLSGLSTENILWAFTTGYASNWHPLTWLSHMLDCQLFGPDPHWHHIINLLFHIANTLLLFTALRQMTGALWKSAFVAAVFALHPLHVESVAWISERKDVLSAFFGILTIICYVRYVKSQERKSYLLTIFIFALDLMAKPMLVTLPFVFLLLDYWPLERFKKKKIHHLIFEKIPFFILSAISCVITFIVQQKGGAVAAMNNFTLSLRIENCFIAYGKYVTQMLWPSKLAVFYPHPMNTIQIWQGILAVWLLLTVSVLIVTFASRHKYLLTGWLWYLGTLVPVIGLVQVGEQAMADRYTYMSLVGLFIIVAWGIPDLSAKWKHQRVLLTVLAPLVILVLSVCTYFQAGYWRNSATLFEHAITVTDRNYLAHHSLGLWFYQQGKLDLSISHNFEALRINSTYSPAYAGLGTAFMQKGRMDEAVKYLTKALQLKYNEPDAMNNLAWLCAVYKGTEFYNPSEAISLAQTACKLADYKNPEMLDTLAVAYAAAGNFIEAAATAEKALNLAKSEGNNQIAEGIRQRLDLFKNGQPYIEPAKK